MNCKFTNVIMFAAGAAIGSAVTWKVLKTKYEQIVQEEIASVKEAFANMADQDVQPDENEETEDEEEERPHQIDWSELEDLEEEEDEYEPDENDLEKYADLTNQYSSEKGGAEKVEKKRPYVIDPYEFGERDGYKTISLTYYADKVLEDQKHKVVTNVDSLIGADSLDTFGRYEDDSVFVRNEQLRTDFEILKDYRTYAEATSVSPKQVENE